MRCLSNKAIMRVRGADCPVRGRVSMDQTIIDLSAVAGAKVGDEVEIIGPDPAAPNSIENLARQAGTIPYEVLVRLGQRVHRTLVP
jgi:alanine racemase